MNPRLAINKAHDALLTAIVELSKLEAYYSGPKYSYKRASIRDLSRMIHASVIDVTLFRENFINNEE